MQETSRSQPDQGESASEWHRRALLRAARQQKWKVACRHISELGTGHLDAEVLSAAVNAAIMERNPVALRKAASLSVRASLSPEVRVSLATRLADAGEALLALALLVADPDVFRRDGVASQAGSILGGTLRNIGKQLGSVEPALQHGVATLARRLLNETTQPILPSPYAFSASPGAVAPPRGTVRVIPAPGLAVDRVAETQSALAQFDRAIATASPPRVQVYRDVFVNHRTQIWRPDGGALQTFNSPIPRQSLDAMAQAPHLPQAAMGLTSHDNTYHWLCEVLPSLAWCLDAEVTPMPILMREAAAPFERASLMLAAKAAPQVTAVAHAVHVDELHMGSRLLAQLAHHEAFASSRSRVIAGAGADALSGSGELIYVSRADSARRVLANERALEDKLAARGFSVIQLSSIPFAQQVAVFARARMIVAPHGAGLAHLLYARPRTTVLEIVPAAPGLMRIRICFARLSILFGLDHHLWLDVPTQPTVGSGWTLDLDAFLPVVDELRAAVPA